MMHALRIPSRWPAVLLGLLLLSRDGSTALADPPDTTTGAAGSASSKTSGGFFSSLKQAFNQHADRDVVWAHFDVGSAPNSHRFYCLIDPATGKHEPNAVAGEPFLRGDGMTGLKKPAISPTSCADAEQKGILTTSGYTVKLAAGRAPGPAAAPPLAAAAATAAPQAASAPAAAAIAPAVATPPRSTGLRAEMEAANASFLAAYNSQDAGAFKDLYTKDAVLLPPSTQAIFGADAIGAFWAERVKDGKRKNHTFEIVSVWGDGRYAYQVARYTVEMINEGETARVTGNTVRIFEKQPDGKWLTKVHIFNSL
jgi:uncharacterized protein (TIGR02246 family)